MENLPGIEQVPLETLTEIFSHFVRQQRDGGYPKEPRLGVATSRLACTSPVTLSHVCAHWRSLALSTPFLWSSIFVGCPKTPNAGHVDIVKAWIQRSGSVPLDLEIQCPCSGNNVLTCPSDSVVAALVEHIGRWRRLEVRSTHRFQKAFCDSVDTENGISLEQIDVNDQLFFNTIYSFPHLQRIHYLNGHGQLDLVAPGPQHYNKLTELYFERILDFHQIHTFLSRSKMSLRKFHVHRFESLHKYEDVIDLPLCLPKLQNFQVNFRVPSHDLGQASIPNICRIIDNLTLPALVSFHLADLNLSTTAIGGKLSIKLDSRTNSGSFNGSKRGWETLQNLLSTFNTQLKKFSFDGAADGRHDDMAISIIQSPLMMALEHLEITAPISDAFIVALHVELDAPPWNVFLPRLKSLRLARCWSTDGVLSSMICSRAFTDTAPSPFNEIAAGRAASPSLFTPTFPSYQGKLHSVHALLYGPGPFEEDVSLHFPGMDLNVKLEKDHFDFLVHNTTMAMSEEGMDAPHMET
ncbi:hypothetical protein FA15DRAFT_698308 [Coprinopsis marcescibilis]|uniref:Uncharacterized protein n=1 Tax=Coprinopsis marcescibilis TaxID=230819 RepID=A0A5C3KD21_COPMA|nr:hypothetical protein FA15DRAFT_698308 [Coprinopsis marcescibilis]